MDDWKEYAGRGMPYYVTKWISEAAARGHVECFAYLHELGSKLGASDVNWEAIECGNLCIVTYCHERGLLRRRSACTDAAWAGHANVLAFLHHNGYPWDEKTTTMAAMRGHFDCFVYAIENGCPIDNEICALASDAAHLDILRYAHGRGLFWDVRHGCARAARAGYYAIVRYAHESGCTCEAGMRACQTAAESTLPFGAH